MKFSEVYDEIMKAFDIAESKGIFELEKRELKEQNPKLNTSSRTTLWNVLRNLANDKLLTRTKVNNRGDSYSINNEKLKEIASYTPYEFYTKHPARMNQNVKRLCEHVLERRRNDLPLIKDKKDKERQEMLNIFIKAFGDIKTGLDNIQKLTIVIADQRIPESLKKRLQSLRNDYEDALGYANKELAKIKCGYNISPSSIKNNKN